MCTAQSGDLFGHVKGGATLLGKAQGNVSPTVRFLLGLNIVANLLFIASNYVNIPYPCPTTGDLQRFLFGKPTWMDQDRMYLRYGFWLG